MNVSKLVSMQSVWSMMAVMMVCHTEAADIRLAWDPPAELAAGYKLYYGQSSGDYRMVVDVGNRTSFTVSGLEEGQRYYFTVTAYDDGGNESPVANEVDGIPTIPSSGLPRPVAAYAFDEGSGSVVSDTSGEGNHGTIVGATWTSQGRFGGALIFDGVDDWVSISEASALHLTTNLTLSAWIYPTAPRPGLRTVMSTEHGSYHIHASSELNRPFIGIDVDGTYHDLYGERRLPAHTWTHLASTYDGNTLRLYQNGVEVASRSLSGPAQGPVTWLAIGGNSLGREFFQGRIDEVRIYNGALTASEIQAVMETPLLLPPEGDILPTEGIPASADMGGSGEWQSMSGIQTDSVGATAAISPGAPQGGELQRASHHPSVSDRSNSRSLVAAISKELVPEQIEIGEVQVGHQWKRVELRKPFVDPVVVAKTTSDPQADPAQLRIRAIDTTGFEVRLQPWDHHDRIRPSESVGYLVIERGHYTLMDGILVEAGIVEAGGIDVLTRITFGQRFTVTPVVITAIISGNEGGMVRGKPTMIGEDGFQYGLETSSASHVMDIPVRLAYVAWEPSWGVIDGLTFEVKRFRPLTPDLSQTIWFEDIFDATPVFLADVQGPADQNALGIRWNEKSPVGIVMTIDLAHAARSATTRKPPIVGYIAISNM
jgi:hypothetical protein